MVTDTLNSYFLGKTCRQISKARDRNIFKKFKKQREGESLELEGLPSTVVEGLQMLYNVYCHSHIMSLSTY